MQSPALEEDEEEVDDDRPEWPTPALEPLACPASIFYIITAKSGGFHASNSASITINDVRVEVEKNENGTSRGLHIVVINPDNGKVDTKQVFDTHKSPTKFDEFIDTKLPDGHIVAAACQDDCVTALSEKGKAWFAAMGSDEMRTLGLRESFAFVGFSGQSSANEQAEDDTEEDASVT